jgi:hypothetical protein
MYFDICFFVFQKLTAKFWFHLDWFKISKFWTWQWQKLKKVNIAVTYSFPLIENYVGWQNDLAPDQHTTNIAIHVSDQTGDDF